MIEDNVLGVILAGGRSSRFGSNKADARLGNKTLLEHTIAKVEKNFSEVLIVSNEESIKTIKKNIFLVKDFVKGQLGPLIGVLSAMKWIEKNNKKYKWIVTFPCDTPFFDDAIIEKLKNCSISGDYLLFFINSKKKRHNIFGLWSLKLIDILEEDIRSNNFRKVDLWADKIGVKNVEVNTEEFDKFLNINTLDDFEEAKKNLDKI
jgi:molybdopterin-guanine dinucleotide biosynthesis protein A